MIFSSLAKRFDRRLMLLSKVASHLKEAELTVSRNESQIIAIGRTTINTTV